MNDDAFISVALSIMDNPGRRGIAPRDFQCPRDLFDHIDRRKMDIQLHLQNVYGRDPLLAAEKILSRCEKLGFDVVSYWDDSYPQLLREIPSPPAVIYVSGDALRGIKIAIVGTRDAAENSTRSAHSMARELSRAGLTVVSGMAFGVDRYAHLGALEGPGGTVAILPCSIDRVYPAGNSDVYNRIKKADNSGFVSEYPPGINSLQKWTFARRNRIISGLAEHVIIVQAGEKSGAMITAQCAIDQNRSLLVCTGNYGDGRFAGCNRLIRSGATPVGSIEDIFEEVFSGQWFPGRGLGDKPKAPMRELNDRESFVVDCIREGKLDIDLIIRSGSFPASEINETINFLELDDILEREGNRVYLRTK